MKHSLRAVFIGLTLALASGPVLAQPAQRAVPQSRAEVTLSFAPIVKRVAPAVVNVYAQRKIRGASNPFFEDRKSVV